MKLSWLLATILLVLSVCDGTEVGEQPHALFDQMILVEKGDVNQCIFEHAAAIKSGEIKPLTLSSHPGKSIAKQYKVERYLGEWRYIESKGGNVDEAIQVKYEDFTFLKLADDDLVFDVAFWQMKVGTPVNFVGGSAPDKTYMYGGGKDFVINDDGTISCKHQPSLVLGFATDRVVREYYIGHYSMNYEDARMWCKGSGGEIAVIYTTFDQQEAKQACGKHTCWLGLEEVGGDQFTPKAQQVWKWSSEDAAAIYTNWASTEPNNFNGIDERNSIMNCCEAECTSCDAKWYDAPGFYDQPRPLCMKYTHVSQFFDTVEDTEDLIMKIEPIVLISAIVVAGIVLVVLVLVHYKVGPFGYQYQQVYREAPEAAGLEMFVHNPTAIVGPGQPPKII